MQAAGLELIDCSAIEAGGGFLGGFNFEKVGLRDLIQFFIQMEQMQSAGVPLLDALSDVRDSADNQRFKDMLTDISRDVADGSALSEAFAVHPKVFNNLHVSLIKAGEDTGDLTGSYKQLIKYMKWVDDMQTKVRKATKYPMMVMVVVILTIVVMMGVVVPEIIGFIENLDQELPIQTTALIATSAFFKKFWYLILGFPVVFLIFVKVMSKASDEFAYRWDAFMLNMPVMGPIIRKLSIARYAQTFGALFDSGIDVLGALSAARRTVSNRALLDALESVERYVSSGGTLSDSFNACGEFPSLVIRMLKIGEESGNLAEVLEQVSEYYTKDVDEAIDGLISMIEPALTGLLGGMILWIAAAVFGPIYSSFENIDF